MKRRLLLISLMLVTLVNVPSQYVFSADHPNRDQVQVFANDKTGKVYIVLGQIIAKATQNENCVKKLQNKTVDNGGNLIINYESGATGTQGAWLGGAVIICKGIAARWATAGEQGQTSFDPNAPLPVLMK